MSVTVHTTPQAYTPCYNGQWFVASSTQAASPNFTYTVKVTDVITSSTTTYEVEQRPDTKLVFDASNVAKNYIKNFVPNNQYGFQLCTDAIRKMRVNIGETYGTTPVYASGANQEYLVWNGVVRYLDFPDFDYNDYVYNSTNTNIKYLTQLFNKQTYIDKSLFLYALTSQANDIGVIRINSFDESNNAIGTSDITNPYVASTTYTDKYLALDIGRKGLDNISSGSVTSYPVLPAGTKYYTVQDVSLVGSPSSFQVTDLFRVDIICEPRHDVYSLQFLNKNGDFENILFSKVSEINIGAEKTYFRQNQYELNSNVWEYDVFTEQEVILNSSATKRIRLNTDWLTEEQIDGYQCVVNGKAYLDIGSTIGLIPVKVMTNSYKVNKKFNERLFSLQLDIEYTFKENYQHG